MNSLGNRSSSLVCNRGLVSDLFWIVCFGFAPDGMGKYSERNLGVRELLLSVIAVNALIASDQLP